MEKKSRNLYFKTEGVMFNPPMNGIYERSQVRSDQTVGSAASIKILSWLMYLDI